VVEHPWLVEERLGHREGTPGVAGKQRARGEIGGGVDVDRHGRARIDSGAHVPARRILITGVANFWGANLARALLADADVEQVVGIDTRTPPADVAAAVTLVDADLLTPELRTLIRASAVDTVVHADVPQFPEPGRAVRQLHEVTVMGTLQLLAASADLPTLRTLVVRGSAAIYGSEPGAPAFFTEDMAARGFDGRATRFQRDMVELEKLVEGFARRRPDVTCTVLRCQPVIGSTLQTPITQLLRSPVVPVTLGFDPRVQVLHETDSIDVLQHAVHHPLAGAVNVAGPGAISLSAAIRRMGRRALPIPHPLFGAVAGAGSRLGLPPMSEDTVRYLRFGRGVATERMTGELGFTPRYDTRAAIGAVADELRAAR
jgi:UDP-glucose 4-epimerase